MGIQFWDMLWVWPWYWYKNQWRLCWSISFGFACWPWQPYFLWRKWAKQVRANDEKEQNK